MVFKAAIRELKYQTFLISERHVYAGRAELDRGHGLRAKSKSLRKPTWNHHEQRQNNLFEIVCQRVCFFLTKKTWFHRKNFYFCMTNTLWRNQNLNLWFQPENPRFEVPDRNSRMWHAWHAQWLSCCKNTSGWRRWYQERLVLKFLIRELKQRRFWATHVDYKWDPFHFKTTWQY